MSLFSHRNWRQTEPVDRKFFRPMDRMELRKNHNDIEICDKEKPTISVESFI